MSTRHTDPARIVFDPAIPPRELRALRAADRARAAVTAPVRVLDHRADRILFGYLFTAIGRRPSGWPCPASPGHGPGSSPQCRH
jgi:hypothetical protein